MESITITLSGDKFNALLDYAEQNLWREFTDITIKPELDQLCRKAESMGMPSTAKEFREQWETNTLNIQAKEEAEKANYTTDVFKKLGEYFKP